MNQDINLLAAGPRAVREHPRADVVAIVLLLMFLSAAALVVWSGWQQRADERQLRALNTAVDEMVVNLEERSRFLAERNADAALVAELERREREADDKSRVLNLLQGEAVGNADGFSGHLAAFGRRHPKGLWLTRIRVSDGGQRVDLRGKTLDADLIPKFLDELQQEPDLSGTTFAALMLSRAGRAGTPLSFALTSTCTQTDDGGQDSCLYDETDESP